MGNKKLNFILDGFGRYNKFMIEKGTVKFSSKMLNTQWLEMCEKAKDILPSFIFKETRPPRWMSEIPFVNFYYQKYNDNNWVMPVRMPDGKTYVSMTDSPQMLKLDTETLEQLGFLEW